MKHDIRTRSDIESLIDHFYDVLLQEKEMHHIFFDIAKIDLGSHKPILYAFWESMILHTGHYQRNVMKAHLDLHFKYPLKSAHFEHWLKIFQQTVDHLFMGPKADESKEKAHSIAALMQMKISHLNA